MAVIFQPFQNLSISSSIYQAEGGFFYVARALLAADGSHWEMTSGK
jgi:hypothetical protein